MVLDRRVLTCGVAHFAEAFAGTPEANPATAKLPLMNPTSATAACCAAPLRAVSTKPTSP
jgi:hypothetical protein